MMTSDMEYETPVLIVGGGPVGLALAGELGWRGVECILIEQTDGAILTPKMNEVNTRTMEYCRRWGIDSRVLDTPFPRDHPMDVAFVTSLSGYELGRLPRPAKKDQTPGPHSPTNLQICPQFWFDPILREFADSHAAVRLLYRCKLEDFTEDENGVTATVHYLDEDRTARLRARYLVGCDGGNSEIRRARNIGLEGAEVLSRPLHAFFRTPDLFAQVGMKPATFILAIDREGLWANIRIIDPVNGLWRLMILDTSEGFEVGDEDLEAFLRRAVGRDISVEWVGLSVWIRRGVVAERYSDGRVFLAGDAVHQLSPTGALGMNTGIGDAVDLGWKLAATIDGWGGAKLLDSYDAERRAVGRRNVAMATEFFNNHDGFGGLDWIEDEGAEADARRRGLGDSLIENVARMFRSIGLQIGYRYDDSPICVSDGTPAPPDTAHSYEPTARPGARAPHAWLADRRSTLDLFGRGFTLVQFGADDGDGVRLAQAAQTRGVPLDIAKIDDADIAALYDSKLALVRPDGHVAWRGDRLDMAPEEIIDRVRGS